MDTNIRKRPVITMKECDSSQLSSYGFDIPTGTLAVKFNSGATYHYQGVPDDVYAGLDSSKSVGKYFSQHIRGAYPYENIDADDATAESIARGEERL